MGDELRSQLHAIYSANFNDGEPVGERYGSSDMVNVSQVIDFIDDHLVEFIQQEIAKARQQGWHEGRAAANNPDIQYGYSPNGQTLKEHKEDV